MNPPTTECVLYDLGDGNALWWKVVMWWCGRFVPSRSLDCVCLHSTLSFPQTAPFPYLAPLLRVESSKYRPKVLYCSGIAPNIDPATQQVGRDPTDNCLLEANDLTGGEHYLIILFAGQPILAGKASWRANMPHFNSQAFGLFCAFLSGGTEWPMICQIYASVPQAIAPRFSSLRDRQVQICGVQP